MSRYAHALRITHVRKKWACTLRVKNYSEQSFHDNLTIQQGITLRAAETHTFTLTYATTCTSDTQIYSINQSQLEALLVYPSPCSLCMFSLSLPQSNFPAGILCTVEPWQVLHPWQVYTSSCI